MSLLKFDPTWRLMKQFHFEVDPDFVNERLMCILCKRLTIDTYEATCGCRFCHHCVEWYSRDQSNHCPGGKNECKDELLVMDVNVTRNLRTSNKVWKVKVFCPNETCHAKVELREMEEHLGVCKQTSIQCPLMPLGCGTEKTSKETMLNHLHNESLSHMRMLIEWVENLENKFNDLKECRENENRIETLEDESMNMANKVLMLENQSSTKEEKIVLLENEIRMLRNKVADETDEKGSMTRATVVTWYFASNSDELTCVPGQIVTITDQSSSDWYKVEIAVNGSLKSGWIPRHCIAVNQQGQDNVANDRDTSDPMTASGYDQCLTMATTFQCEDGFQSGDRLISIYPYSAQNTDELTFDKSAVIQLLSKDEPEWWRGRNVFTGMVGLFPVNYVRRPQPNCLSDDELIQQSVHIPPDEVSGSYPNVSGRPISWYIDGNVKFNAILTEDEKRRQFYIVELIETEKAYYEDLQEVHTVFYEPISKANLITDNELKHIFINWTELIPKSYNFYMALKIRRENGGVKQPIQCIGDILLSNFPNFIIYVRFCSLQNQAISLLEKKKQMNVKFKDFCTQCEGNLRCKKMPMTSYFLKPMQRITKYKLLVENVLKYTEESHPDRGDMEEAVAAARSLCEAVNEGIKEKENAERLEWIQDHVNCDVLGEKLYFNSTTNSLGHRKLIYSGTLYKAKSGKELVGFLFNDFLLLSTPSYNTNGCPFVFPLETSSTSKMQFKVYKKPILLNRILVMTGSGPSHNSVSVTTVTGLFNNSSSNDIFTIKDAAVDHVLKALSVNDRDKWVERLVAASLQYIEIENTVREISMSIRRSAGVGRLIVTVLEAMNLKGCGVAENKTNSYCEASLGNQLRRSKVVSSTYNPKWNCHMQFLIKNINLDVLCVAVYDKEYFAPNDFLGRTEIALKDIKKDKEKMLGPVEKRLKLMGVNSGELLVRLDLALFRSD